MAKIKDLSNVGVSKPAMPAPPPLRKQSQVDNHPLQHGTYNFTNKGGGKKK